MRFFPIRKARLSGVIFGGLLLLVACASSRMSYRVADQKFRNKDYQAAAESLIQAYEKAGEENRDELLYLFDIGLSYHLAGQYQKSNQFLLRADRITEITDYTSLAKEASTLLISENVKYYEGEDFEKVLVNVYLAMNFAFMGNLESALVEARRVNRKLYRMIHEGKRKYQQSVFARYFSGVLYEASGEWNDAYVSYKKTRTLRPELEGLGYDLWRAAWKTRDIAGMRRWKKEYSLQPDRLQQIKKKYGYGAQYGELVVLYQNGISPIKRPHPQWHSVPRFYPRYNPVSYAEVSVGGKEQFKTILLDDIEAIAIQNLEEKWGPLIAKKMAGVVAKETAAYGVGEATNSPFLRALTRAALYAADQADLRSWNLLPKDLQMVRIRLPVGEHSVVVRPVGQESAQSVHKVTISAGKTSFLNTRFMP